MIDQYDLGMEYVGHAPHGGYSRVVTRGDVDKREFLAFWLDSANKVLAGMNVNIWDAGDAIKELVASSRPVDRSRFMPTYSNSARTSSSVSSPRA